MYKLLLCLRYLRTRYIALASIISVMLGVATMIVVNSVMAGFTREMQDRIHGILSDVTFDSRSLGGIPDAEWHMNQIKAVAGDSIEGMTATVTVPAMLNFQCGNNWITRQVHVIGIDETTQSRVSDFGKYLQHEGNRLQMSFTLRDGYDTRDHQVGPEAPQRKQMKEAGWTHRRHKAEAKEFEKQFHEPLPPPADPLPVELPPAEPQESLELEPSSQSRADDTMLRVVGHEDEPRPVQLPDAPLELVQRLPRQIEPQSYEAEIGENEAPAPLPEETLHEGPQPTPVDTATRIDPFAERTEGDDFDPAREQHTGVVLGIALASFRQKTGEDVFMALPGDDVKLTFPTVGMPPKAVSGNFTIVDFYESKMSEYDSSFVFVPIRALQEDRGMFDYVGDTKRYYVNSIQIKLKPGADGTEVRDKLRAAFPQNMYAIQTWRDKQGPLLAAVQMETAILNVLLFLIIAVAGFGILAIFLMIVVEKTRDIGILKSLGASRQGVMGIFLAYGLSLGLVGSGVGLVLGLLFVRYINEIADLLGKITGRPVFDPSVYYFYKIPWIVDPVTVTWIVAGAITIAVMASILPAFRAAMLHPVEALRYE